MPENLDPPTARMSVAEQLTEVYALVDELHEVTDRIRDKMDRIIREHEEPPK